ncbi:MAG: hypothetical protein IKI31_06010, partial [Treponema sp.]|nr:hypothetical protein [Treponema sp.]
MMKNFSRGCKKSCFLCALVLCVFSIAGISCYNGTFNEAIFRTMNDPSDECAKVSFTSKECTIYVSWQKDNGADSFRLMRSIDNTFLNFSCIYEGRNTNYVDSDVIEKTRYVYRLDKIRGSKYYAGKYFSYGFASDCRMDEYENNDTEECATFLESDLICNLPCARFVTKGHEMFDED